MTGNTTNVNPRTTRCSRQSTRLPRASSREMRAPYRKNRVAIVANVTPSSHGVSPAGAGTTAAASSATWIEMTKLSMPRRDRRFCTATHSLRCRRCSSSGAPTALILTAYDAAASSASP